MEPFVRSFRNSAFRGEKLLGGLYPSTSEDPLWISRNMDHQSTTPWPAELIRGAAGARVLFEHHGAMEHGTVERLLAEAEEASMLAGDPVGLRKRLFNVLVEGLENVHRHTLPEHQHSGFAALVADADGYRLLFANAVPVAMAALLTHRVSILNEMDEDALKAHYLTLLASEGRTERGGAGLGLLTMARKSARPIVVQVRNLDPMHAMVALELRVDRKV